MGIRKYQFNRESLSYTQVERGLRWYVGLVCKLFLAGLALAVLVYVVFSLFAYTPHERRLALARAALDSAVAELNAKYEQVSAVIADIESRDRSIYRTIFESEPSQSDAEAAEQAVTKLYQQLASEGKEQLLQRTKGILRGLDTLSAVQSMRFDTVMRLARQRGDEVRYIPSVQPVDNGKLTSFVASFGRRVHPFYKVLRMHTGVDYALPVGSPVYATADGRVESVRQSQRGYGNMVTVSHGASYTTVYAHLSKISVRPGQTVSRGDEVGEVGDSGLSMAPHLHYEVLFDGAPVDPLNYFFGELPPHEIEQMVRNVSQRGQTLD